MTDTLSDKQALFCREYIVDFNATKAAIRAGYSKKTAKQQGSRLLTNDDISVKVSELVAERMKAADVTTERVLMEFARIAMSDVGEAYDEHGNLKPLKEMPEDVRRCISGLETEELWEWDENDKRKQTGVIRKVKFWDKKGSLDSLGKYLKMFVERHELTADESLTSLIARAFAK
jgi:phage terminase small subunit